MAGYGVSTVGIKFGYSATTATDTLPSSMVLLTRINQIGGINLETEQIDASALEDYITRYISGRADTGGSVSVTINVTDDTMDEWEDVISASETAKAAGRGLWFEVWSPYLAKGFWFEAQTPTEFPMPELGQNSLETVEIPLTIVSYKGAATKVEPSA